MRDLTCIGVSEVIKRLGIIDIWFRHGANLGKSQQPRPKNAVSNTRGYRNGPQAKNVSILFEAGMFAGRFIVSPETSHWYGLGM